MTTPAFISETLLEQLISSDRFGAYVHATGGDRIRAVALYQWNAAISAAFYETLHYVEVIFRNALHHQLEAVHATIAGRSPGAAWFDEPSWVAHHWFHEQAAAARDKAVGTAGHNPARPRPGKVVAELPFGFWRYLVTPATSRASGSRRSTPPFLTSRRERPTPDGDRSSITSRSCTSSGTGLPP